MTNEFSQRPHNGDDPLSISAAADRYGNRPEIFRHALSVRPVTSREKRDVTFNPRPGTVLTAETDEKARQYSLVLTIDEEPVVKDPDAVHQDKDIDVSKTERGVTIDFDHPAGFAANIIANDKTLPHDVALRILGGAHALDRGPILQRGISLK